MIPEINKAETIRQAFWKNIRSSPSPIGPKRGEVFKEYPKEDINYKSIYDRVVFLFSQLYTYHDELNISSTC